MQVTLMRLMSKGEYLIVPKGTKFTGSGKLGLNAQLSFPANPSPHGEGVKKFAFTSKCIAISIPTNPSSHGEGFKLFFFFFP